MPNKDSKTDTVAQDPNVDLNALADLNFGPSWADANTESSNHSGRLKSSFNHDQKNAQSEGKKIKRDRRGRVGKLNAQRHSNTKQGEYKDRSHFKFEPSFSVKVYPQDNTFDALVKRLRVNCKTYQLFEITRVILEKPERFVVHLSRLDKAEKSDKSIYYSPKDNSPFDTEEAAIDHFIENYVSDYFEVEEVEVDPPSGNFSIVYRCPFTNVLIAPPNYHRFQELLKLHHKDKIKNLSLEEYQSKLESVNDEATISEWLEAMKKGERLTLKGSSDPSTVFQSREEAKRYLILNHKSDIVQSSESIRFPGTLIENLPKGDIKQNINFAIEGQRRFPLETANNIRGRLRRHKFTIYKKGSKGISYVCSVKRKFRDDKTVFTDTINALIEFFEKNQDISVKDLPYKYLNLTKPEESKADDPSPSEAGMNSVDESNSFNCEHFSEAEKESIKQLFRDLKWLITEGYVTEYSNGTLFVHHKLDEHQKTETRTENSKDATIEIESNVSQEKSSEFAEDGTECKLGDCSESADSSSAEAHNSDCEPAEESHSEEQTES